MSEARTELLLDIIRSSKDPTLEVAEALDGLLKLGLYQKTVAEQLGRSESWVSRTTKAYRKATPELRDAWRAGMPIDIVYAVARWDVSAQKEAVEAYGRDGRRGVFTYAETTHAPPPPAKPNAKTDIPALVNDIPALETFLAARKNLPPYVLGVYHGLLLARGDTVDLKDEYHKVMRLAKRLER